MKKADCASITLSPDWLVPPWASVFTAPPSLCLAASMTAFPHADEACSRSFCNTQQGFYLFIFDPAAFAQLGTGMASHSPQQMSLLAVVLCETSVPYTVISMWQRL